MTPTPQFNDAPPAPSRVSILARLIPAFSYGLPAFGAALGAFLFMRVMAAMRMAESAGITAVAGGMTEANVPPMVALYLAIFIGVAGIVVVIVRTKMTTTTANPSAWFFLVTGGIGFLPVLLLWIAQSLLIKAITPGVETGMASVASSIQLCLILTLITAAVGCLILLVASVVPLPSVLRAKQKFAPLIVLVLMELALIGMTVVYQIRTSWFYDVMMERL